MNNALKLVVGVLALLAFGGCAAPKYLINDFTMQDRAVKYVLTPSGGSADEQMLYNYIVRICDLDSSDQEQNCKDTTVVENVYPQSLY